MLQQSGLYHFDETRVAGTTLADLDRDAFQNYFEKISRQPIEAAGVSLEQLLEGTRVAKIVDEVQRLTVAGLPIFGREPQHYMRHSRITAVRFLGNDSTAGRLNPQELNGTLPQLVQQSGEYVKLYNGVYSQIEGFVRRERLFCPEEYYARSWSMLSRIGTTVLPAVKFACLCLIIISKFAVRGVCQIR
jgi:predicted HTH transcriptional regulator